MPFRTSRRGRLLPAGLTLMLLLWLAPAAAVADPQVEARAMVQDTIDSVMAILHDAGRSSEQKKQAVEQVAVDRFNFPVISRLVLARNWKKFDATQRTDFSDAFRDHLSATYRDTLDNFKDERITIEGSRLEKRGDVTVFTLVHSGSDTTRVDYRLRNRSGTWRGIDVIVEGVSIVQNFRVQAQEIVSADGPDGLIERLRAKQIERATES